MFQRRPVRRKLRKTPGFPGEPLGEGQRSALIDANRLMAEGRFSEAAAIFERIAQAAKSRGLSEQTPLLLIQAARCRIINGEVDAGSGLLLQGLAQLKKQRRWNVLRRAGEAAIEELEQRGNPISAGELRAWFEEAMKEAPASAAPAAAPPGTGHAGWAEMRLLPYRCSNCGAALRLDEVEYIDENYVECPYCGSPVQFRAS